MNDKTDARVTGEEIKFALDTAMETWWSEPAGLRSQDDARIDAILALINSRAATEPQGTRLTQDEQDFLALPRQYPGYVSGNDVAKIIAIIDRLSAPPVSPPQDVRGEEFNWHADPQAAHSGTLTPAPLVEDEK